MTRLVLAGGGHAHLSVLERLAIAPHQELEVILISPSPMQFYSGMLPGWIAGHYQLDQLSIDLRPLMAQAGVHFIQQAICGLDTGSKEVCLADGQRIPYDLLSLDVGAETNTSGLEALGYKLLPIKPLAGFTQRWPLLAQQLSDSDHPSVAIIGGGAAGVELVLAVRYAMQRLNQAVTVTLVAGEVGILPGFHPRVRHRTQSALQQVGVRVIHQRARGDTQGLQLGNGDLLEVDAVIAATGSQPHPWIAPSGLQLSADGQVLVDQTHRSLSHPEVFAVGDVCRRSDLELAPSGVNAVRAGPVLADNLLALIDARPLSPYQPRPRALYLVSCGHRYAIASWGRFSAEGYWVWRWKDWIDRRFIRRFTHSKTDD